MVCWKSINKTMQNGKYRMKIKLSLALIILMAVSVVVFSSCTDNNISVNSTDEAVNTTVSEEKTATTKKSATATTAERTTEKTVESMTQTSTKQEKDNSDQKNIVVVLDAGHDSDVHTRNHPNLGVNEQDLNLVITNSAYKRLTQYNGIKVYLSRPDGHCPNDKYGYNYSSEYGDACIHARTEFARKKHPDLFISFHCNASSGAMGASANGSEVYVSKHKNYYSACKKLGKIILNNITSVVDLKSRGVLTRSKPEKGYYDDGTVKDFYYLISNNIDNKIPAMIIEHAFMDNTHDNSILKNKTNLKKLGYADADAIAKYYDLKLK